MSPSFRRILSTVSGHRALWIALAAGLALKAAILLIGSITFDADEAVLGLMARHILQGEFPLFFYGQSYMGALDAYLTVPFFLVFGQTVTAMRLLQICLFAGVIVTTYLAARRLNPNGFSAGAAAMLVAIPPVLFSLYTSSTLGDYGEILLFNNLLLIIGWDICAARKQSPGWWLAAGLIGGLGWWSMGLIVVALLPLALIGVWRYRARVTWARLATLVGGFALGAGPWLYATISRGATGTVSDMSGAWFSGPSAFGDRVLALVLFNLPALFGLRPPWSLDWIILPVGLFIVAGYMFTLWRAGRESAYAASDDVRGSIVRTLMLGWIVMLVLFLSTPFGGDPTGRYLLPLWPYLAILVGDQLGRLRAQAGRWQPVRAWMLLAVCLSYNLWGNVRAMIHNPPGLTKQFDPISQMPHTYDGELIRFLDSIGAERGYSNYWVTFRFAFLTGERVIFSPRLPYKADMSYTYGDDRYAPYSRAVDAARRVVYVTTNHPALDSKITERLAQLGVTFERRQIGPYTVFYNLSRKVTPDELGAFGKVTGRAIHDQ